MAGMSHSWISPSEPCERNSWPNVPADDKSGRHLADLLFEQTDPSNETHHWPYAWSRLTAASALPNYYPVAPLDGRGSTTIAQLCPVEIPATYRVATWILTWKSPRFSLVLVSDRSFGRTNPSPMALKLIEGVLQRMGDRGQDLLKQYRGGNKC